MKVRYGDAPKTLGRYNLEFGEYMHYMYLPIRMPGASTYDFRIPKNLEFAEELVSKIVGEERFSYGNQWDYVYLTARRGFATPGNPLNRPGWHADGFGTSDINYVWTDRYPTLFAVQEFQGINEDHVESIKAFEDQIQKDKIVTFPDKVVLRLDPSVIHAAPEIPAPGGERSFFKISFSNDKYNLAGNSHNYEFDYYWEMYKRDEVRNDPARGGKDAA